MRTLQFFALVLIPLLWGGMAQNSKLSIQALSQTSCPPTFPYNLCVLTMDTIATSLRFSPNSSLLAAGTNGFDVKVWDVRSGR